MHRHSPWRYGGGCTVCHTGGQRYENSGPFSRRLLMYGTLASMSPASVGWWLLLVTWTGATLGADAPAIVGDAVGTRPTFHEPPLPPGSPSGNVTSNRTNLCPIQEDVLVGRRELRGALEGVQIRFAHWEASSYFNLAAGAIYEANPGIVVRMADEVRSSMPAQTCVRDLCGRTLGAWRVTSVAHLVDPPMANSVQTKNARALGQVSEYRCLSCVCVCVCVAGKARWVYVAGQLGSLSTPWRIQP